MLQQLCWVSGQAYLASGQACWVLEQEVYSASEQGEGECWVFAQVACLVFVRGVRWVLEPVQ